MPRPELHIPGQSVQVDVKHLNSDLLYPGGIRATRSLWNALVIHGLELWQRYS
jgi:hypothetical protein